MGRRMLELGVAGGAAVGALVLVARPWLPDVFSDDPSVLALAGFLGLCLLVGVSGAGITASSLTTWFHTLARPPGTPPRQAGSLPQPGGGPPGSGPRPQRLPQPWLDVRPRRPRRGAAAPGR